MAVRDLIINRISSADERGLFFKLPVSYLHTYINDDDTLDMLIEGYNFALGTNCFFRTKYDRNDYIFLDNYSNETILYFKNEFSKTIFGLKIVIDSNSDSCLFYDLFYCIDFSLNSNFCGYNFQPFYFLRLSGNINEDKEFLYNKNTKEEKVMIKTSVLSNQIKEIIFENDVCYTLYKSIILSIADLSIKDEFIPEVLIDNYSILDNKKVSFNKNNYEFKVKNKIVEMRSFQQKIIIEDLQKKLFKYGESLEKIQKEKNEIEKEISALYKDICLNLEIIDEMKRKKIQDIVVKLENNCNFKYKIGLCLLTKNENEYLEEFLVNWWEAGVNHFYIYDNNSDIPVQETIKSIKNGFFIDKCTIVIFSKYKHMQYECYENCLINFGQECEWLGFIDTDELIEFTSEDIKNLPDLLNTITGFGVWIPWQLYGASGHIKKPKGLQKDNFNIPIIDPFGLWGKIFIKTSLVERVYVHSADCLYDALDLNTPQNEKLTFVYGQLFLESREIENNHLYSIVKLNHYITRSYEEWCKKMSRGTCDPNFKRRFNTFFKYNPDLKNLGLESDDKVRQPYF